MEGIQQNGFDYGDVGIIILGIISTLFIFMVSLILLYLFIQRRKKTISEDNAVPLKVDKFVSNPEANIVIIESCGDRSRGQKKSTQKFNIAESIQECFQNSVATYNIEKKKTSTVHVSIFYHKNFPFW